MRGGEPPQPWIPERLGFRLEGRLRDAEWLYDHWVDYVVYTRLATDAADNDD